MPGPLFHRYVEWARTAARVAGQDPTRLTMAEGFDLAAELAAAKRLRPFARFAGRDSEPWVLRDVTAETAG